MSVDRAIKLIQEALTILIEIDQEPSVPDQVVPDQVVPELPEDTSSRSKREWAEEFKKMAEGYVMAKKDKREYLVRLRDMVDRAIQDFDKMVALE